MTRVWADGDYACFADTLLAGLGDVLVAAAAIRPGERVLDVAAGCGNAALPAAACGGVVTASDITPELLAECGRRAGAAGLALDLVPADAQALPFADASFDVALSCVGAIFAPRHADVAAELARIVRPGGRIALLNWTDAGLFGAVSRVAAAFAPPPRPGTGSPELWGDPAYATALLGDAFDLAFAPGTWTFRGFADPAEVVAFFRRTNGATRALFARQDDPAPLAAALTAALAAARAGDAWPTGYVIVTGRRR